MMRSMRLRSVATEALRIRARTATWALALALAAGGCTLLETIPDLSHGITGQPGRDGATGDDAAGDAALLDGAGGGDAGSGGDATQDGAQATYPQTVTSDAPLAYYRFAEASGTTALDEGGLRPGAYNAGVTLGAAGAIAGNAAVLLNGTSGGVDAANIDFTDRAPFTFETWLNVQTIKSTNQMLFQRDLSSGGRQQFGAYINSTEGLVCERWVAGNGVFARSVGPGGVGIESGTFVHVACVYDGSELSLFKDGELLASTPDTRSQAAKVGTKLSIGYDDVGLSYFGGVLDEFAIYDKALSATRLKAHFDARAR